MEEILYGFLGFIIAFLPTLTAGQTKHKNTAAIFVVNLLALCALFVYAGFAALIWFVAMIWAVIKK